MNIETIQHTFTRYIYGIYRRLKNTLQHKNGPATVIFFRLLGVAENLLSGNTRSRLQRNKDFRWKQDYAERFGTKPLYHIITEHTVASESIDHQSPRGATHDSSTNLHFNRRVYELLNRTTNVSLLDLGCAGGGLVRSFLEDGNTAVGIEGSDIPKLDQLCEWSNCPLHLFTCDITRPFSIQSPAGKIETFDLATAWEVLEHIPNERLPSLIENIKTHLSPGGYFVASVDQTPDINPLTGSVYHVTLKDKPWWTEQFISQGFSECAQHPFQTKDFVRGNGLGLKNWDPADGDGFHLVLQRI